MLEILRKLPNIFILAAFANSSPFCDFHGQHASSSVMMHEKSQIPQPLAAGYDTLIVREAKCFLCHCGARELTVGHGTGVRE